MISKLTGTVTPVLGIVRSLSVVMSKPVHHAFRVVAVLPQFGPTFVIVWRRTSPESSGSVTPRTHGAHASRATATCLNEGNMVKDKDKGWVLEKKILQKNVVKAGSHKPESLAVDVECNLLGHRALLIRKVFKTRSSSCDRLAEAQRATDFARVPFLLPWTSWLDHDGLWKGCVRR